MWNNVAHRISGPRGDRMVRAGENLKSARAEQNHAHVWRHARRALVSGLALAALGFTSAALVTTWSTATAIGLVCGLIAVAYVALRVEPQKTAALATTVVALGIVIGAVVISGLWWPVGVIASLAIIVAWRTPRLVGRHYGHEFITTGVMQAAIATTVLAVALGWWADILGLAVVLAVAVWFTVRCGWWAAARFRWLRMLRRVPATPVHRYRRRAGEYSVAAQVMEAENLETGVEGEQLTAGILQDLDSRWTVLHSRILPGGNADADHLLVGPAGLVVLDSKVRRSRVRLDGTWDEDSTRVLLSTSGTHDLHSLVTPTAVEMRRVALAMGVPVDAEEENPLRSAVVAYGPSFTEDVLPVSVQFLDLWDEQMVWADVDIVHPDALLTYLTGLPAWPVHARPSRILGWLDGARHDETTAVARHNERHWRDIGTIAEYVFPRRD